MQCLLCSCGLLFYNVASMARLLMENVFPFRRGNAFRAWLLKTESSTGRDGGITDELALRYIATIVAEPLLRQRKP